MQDKLEFDRSRVLQDVTRGVEHLHSLGLIHVSSPPLISTLLRLADRFHRPQNDINPRNIVLTSDLSRAVLIDFDSMQKEGYLFVEGAGDKHGTYGWMKEYRYRVAEKENDLHALAVLKRYLDGETIEV
jgi:serine/threonine protein kinase